MTDEEKLLKFFEENQRLPTYQEMTVLFNVVSKNTAFYRIKKLLDRGFLEKKGRHIIIKTYKRA